MAGLSCEQAFFHGSLGRGRAEALLTASPDDGTYIVRTSSSAPGNYVLTVVAQRAVLHFQIKNQGECWFSIDDGPLFEGLDDLIEHYSHLPDGLPCALSKHIPRRPPRVGLRDGNTKLHEAAAAGKPMSVAKHAASKDVNAKNSLGRTALMECCRISSADCARSLLAGKQTVDVNTADTQGWTALHFAAANGNSRLVRELLQRSANVKALTADQESPRQVASRLGNSEACRILSDVEDGHSLERVDAMLELVWYHGKLTRTAAENIISIYGLEDGLFLVRFSPSSGNFILTTCYEQAMFHFQIQYDSKKRLYFIDDGPGCHSLADLIQYYSTKADGLPCALIKYCKRSQKGPGLTHDSMSVYATGSLSTSTAPQQPVVPPSTQYEAPAESRAHADDYNRMHQLDRMLADQAQVSRDAINIIQYSSLHLGNELGAGEFGAVFGGTWRSDDGRQVDVAVKTIKPERMGSKDDFLREAQLMSSLKHPNIVQLLGIVEQPSLMIVQELVPNGSLENYFQKTPKGAVTDFQRVLWGSQIANGMAYLEKNKFVHRDLATRNILLDERLFAKISDFGLSRAYEDNYYQASTGGRWPVRWYAPESINYGKFTSRSDVWSFGVTLWEIWSHGAMPYDKMTGPEVVDFLGKGGRLAKPRKCPQPVAEIMMECWRDKYQERPTFASLLRRLTTLLRTTKKK